MKASQWLILGTLLTICTSCGMFDYLKAHPQVAKDAEAVVEDSVKVAEAVAE